MWEGLVLWHCAKKPRSSGANQVGWTLSRMESTECSTITRKQLEDNEVWLKEKAARPHYAEVHRYCWTQPMLTTPISLVFKVKNCRDAKQPRRAARINSIRLEKNLYNCSKVQLKQKPSTVIQQRLPQPAEQNWTHPQHPSSCPPHCKGTEGKLSWTSLVKEPKETARSP